MKVGVPRETAPGERRIALVPDVISKLVKAGTEVVVEDGAGADAFFPRAAYESAGAKVLPDARAVCAEADIVLKVQRPQPEEVDLLREGSILVSLLHPHLGLDLVRRLADRKVTAFSMDLVPRITRAQDIDALSSQSTLAGYKAVLVGAAALGRLLPMISSAAGTLMAARTLVIGAGVAGLQAIATARRLGSVVSAFDIRPATKEQVQSLGATFVEMEIQESTEDKGGYAKELSKDAQDRALAAVRKALRTSDLFVTTALIPGKPAPRLILADMLPAMKPGSVIVDLAAEMGGNCEATEAGKEIVRDGVIVIGPVNLPSTIPTHASQMYARNLQAFLKILVKDGKLNLDFEDQVIRDMCVTHDGQVRHEPTRKLIEGGGS
jgi:NAD(P) transhydrogenase subunit alpha